MDVMLAGVKFLTLENEQIKPFTVMFGGVFSHKNISTMFPNLSVTSAGFISIDEAGIIEPYGYSSTLKVGANTPSLSNGHYKGVLMKQGGVAFFTDDVEALLSSLNEDTKGGYSIRMGRNGFHRLSLEENLDKKGLKQVKQSYERVI